MQYEYLLFFLYIHFVHAHVPVVNTTQGPVKGLKADDGDYYKYYGIRYGVVNPKNPFGPALAPPSFEGIFEANDDTAICPQTGFHIGDPVGSLDCLHLNVFVPTKTNDTLLPVLIFIHGGVFAIGFSGEYGAKFFMRHDIILVTLNYRLGPFGFMCTDNPRVPGNEGLKDQLMALRWVQDNIAKFGGDPNRVTISGNSAGAMSTDLQIISNGNKKLFQQVILQSGSANIPDYPPTVRDTPLLIANFLGFPTRDMDEALDFLANVHPLQIMNATAHLRIEFRPCVEHSFNGVTPFMTDNWVSKTIISSVEGVNVLMGFNANEALGVYVFPDSDIRDVISSGLSGTYVIEHDDFNTYDEVRHFFFGDDEIDESKLQDAIDLRSDLSFVYPSIRTLNRYLKSKVGKLYLYKFSYDGERNLLKMGLNTTIEGAIHADEYSYLYDLPNFGEPNEDDQLTIDRMTMMWSNFVKYGNPTPKVTELLPVQWQPITPTSPTYYINIGSKLEARRSIFHERMAFWDVFHEANAHLQRFVLENKKIS